MRVSFFLKLSCFFLILMISHPLKAIDFEYPKKNVLRLAVIGLVHDHVNWILNRKQSDVKIELPQNVPMHCKKSRYYLFHFL